MSQPTLTRDMPPLALRATFKPGTVNVEKRTVDLVWTTGARVLRGFWDPYWEELSLDPAHVRLGRLNNGAPFLRDHGDTSFLGGGARTEHVIGVHEAARLEGKEGVATVRFAKAEDDPEADRIFRKIQDGILQNVSVGYRVHKLEKVEESSDGYPIYRATDWEPYEVSVVAMGADDGAGFRSARTQQQITNPCQFITPGGVTPRKEYRTMPQRNTEDVETKEKKNEEVQGQAGDEEKRKAAELAQQAERQRASEIRKLVRSQRLDEKLADEMIEKGTSVESARATVLDELAKRFEAAPTSTATRAEVGETDGEKRMRGMQAWLIERSGMSRTIEDAKKHPRVGRRMALVDVDGGEFRGMSLIDMARHFVEKDRPGSSRGLSKMELVGRAFTMRGGMQTTSDFAVLLENTMHKLLLGAYAITPDTWSRFCRTDMVPDFRPSNRYRTGSFGSLDSLTEAGEYTRKAAPDGVKFTIETDTKGNTIAVTRKTIINDDMGALADLATAFGRAAGLTIEKEVYALLAQNGGLGPTMDDGKAFFHVDHANINATGSTISVDGLDADATVMASQKDPNNNEILELQPAVLLVARGLRGQALILNQSQFEPTSNKLQIPNRVAGLFRDVVGTARLTGTRRYLFAEPGQVAAFVVAFLEGQGEAPVLESREGWDVDGTEWKVRLDALAQAFDVKGAVTNAGQ